MPARPFRTIQDDQQQAGSFGCGTRSPSPRRLPLILAITLAERFSRWPRASGSRRPIPRARCILLKQDDPNLLEVSSQPQTMAPNTPRMDTETDLMTSPSLPAASSIRSSHRRSGLQHVSCRAPRRTDAENRKGSWPPASRPRLHWVKSALPSFGEEDNAPLPLPSVAARPGDHGAPVQVLNLAERRELRHHRDRNDNDPKMAAALADAVTRLYLEWSAK